MKKILLCVAFFQATFYLSAQVDTSATTPELKVTDSNKPKPKKKYNLSNRANDHFLLQLGYTQWAGAPDSIVTRGFSRSINTYFMFDFPFKTTPQLSVAAGLGIASDHMMFDSTYVNVKGVNRLQTGTYSTLRFDRTPYNGATGYFKKSKLATVYLELPVELRYVTNPEKSDRSFKFAIGGRVGTMIKAGTRNRKFKNSNLFPTDYTLKENSKRYFNTTRIVGTARIGYGHFTLFGSYQFTNLLKDGAGPELRPYTIGLSIGGL